MMPAQSGGAVARICLENAVPLTVNAVMAVAVVKRGRVFIFLVEDVDWLTWLL